MNWKFLLASAFFLIIAFLIYKDLLKDLKLKRSYNDGRGMGSLTRIRGWGLFAFAIIAFTIMFFKGIFNLN